MEKLLSNFLLLLFKLSLVLLIGSIGVFISAHAQSIEMQYESGWETHTSEGETRCALGDKYEYYTRTGNPKKLLIHFTGGGSCWSGAMCDPESSRSTNYNYKPKNRHPEHMDGIFNLQKKANPFHDYTVLVAPTCTGDVVLGDSVITYTYKDRQDRSKDITIYHKGYANGMATLKWAFKHIPEPEIVVVSGSSAGGVATPFYANIVAGHYENVRVIGISDAVGHLDQQTLKGDLFSSWNLQSFLRNHTAFSDLDPSNIGVPSLFNAAANKNVPNLELYQVNQAFDIAGRFYLGQMGFRDVNLLEIIRQNHQKIKANNPEYRSFLIGGEEHRLLQEAWFYFFTSQDMLPNKWIDQILAEKQVQNVICSKCERPGLRFSEMDQKIISIIKELLNEKQKWNPNDDFRQNRTCNQTSAPYSLRCALWVASGKIGGSPDDYPVKFALKYSAKEKMGNQVNYRAPILTQYNNWEKNTYHDIFEFIKEIEQEIKRNMNK